MAGIPAAERTDERRVPAGTMIFRQYDPGEEMFVIARGRVRLTITGEGHERELAVLQAGDFFGELSLLSGARRTATAVAVDDCDLLTIRRDVFAMMMQDDLEAVFRIMDGLGQRLSQTDQQVRQLAHALGRVRMVAVLLRRCLPANGYPSAALDPRELARAWEASAETVEATLAELAREGAGVLRDGRWWVESREQTERLAELVARYAS